MMLVLDVMRDKLRRMRGRAEFGWFIIPGARERAWLECQALACEIEILEVTAREGREARRREAAARRVARRKVRRLRWRKLWGDVAHADASPCGCCDPVSPPLATDDEVVVVAAAELSAHKAVDFAAGGNVMRCGYDLRTGKGCTECEDQTDGES